MTIETKDLRWDDPIGPKLERALRTGVLAEFEGFFVRVISVSTGKDALHTAFAFERVRLID